MALTLGKTERLKSALTIKEIFASRRSVSEYPLRVVWSYNNEDDFRAAFSVSKKSFKRAVDRNRIKRLMREVYRLQREQALQGVACGCDMVFVYVDSKMPEYAKLYSSMTSLLDKLSQKISEKKSE